MNGYKLHKTAGWWDDTTGTVKEIWNNPGQFFRDTVTFTPTYTRQEDAPIGERFVRKAQPVIDASTKQVRKAIDDISRPLFNEYGTIAAGAAAGGGIGGVLSYMLTGKGGPTFASTLIGAALGGLGAKYLYNKYRKS